jgi:hypothetical protein
MEKTNKHNARTTRKVHHDDVIDATVCAWVETKNAGVDAQVKFPEDSDLDVDLTILKEYVNDELVRLGCMITRIEVTKYETLQGVQPMMRVIFNRNKSHYFSEIESASDDKCTQFDIDVTVERSLTEDQLPPLNLLNTGDSITICRYPRDIKAIQFKEPFPPKSHPDDELVLQLRHRVRDVFNCKKQDNSDVAAELVKQIFEISKL